MLFKYRHTDEYQKNSKNIYFVILITFNCFRALAFVFVFNEISFYDLLTKKEFIDCLVL